MYRKRSGTSAADEANESPRHPWPCGLSEQTGWEPEVACGIHAYTRVREKVRRYNMDKCKQMQEIPLNKSVLFLGQHRI